MARLADDAAKLAAMTPAEKELRREAWANRRRWGSIHQFVEAPANSAIVSHHKEHFLKGTLWDDTAEKSLMTPSSANESILSAFTERHQSVNCTRRPQAPVPRVDLAPYISKRRARESMSTKQGGDENDR